MLIIYDAPRLLFILHVACYTLLLFLVNVIAVYHLIFT